MSPAHDCLGVWELLENVLLNLSATDLTRVMRVSQIWKHLIKQSARLRNNLVVVPVARTVTCTRIVEARIKSIPEYAPDAELRVNPVLQAKSSMSTWKRKPTGKQNFDFSLPTTADGPLQGCRNEFATFPPCQRILVHKISAWTVCTVFVKEGIRIRDLLTVAASLHATDRRNYGEYEGDNQALARVITRTKPLS